MAKTIKIKRYKRMDNPISQSKGLMFSKRVELPLIFVFRKDVRHSFHSLFCPAFDIVFLNKDNETVYCEEVRAAKKISPKTGYRYAVEAPPGFIKKNGIRKKTNIQF